MIEKPDKPPTYEELVAEVARLKNLLAIRDRSIGTLQATMVARDAEHARAVRKKAPLIEMDPKAKDKFRRPY